MSTSESMDYQEDKENISEKMECEGEEKSLSIREILSEARRKLLKYQRKRWHMMEEEMREFFMNDSDDCPECNALMVENFQCVNAKRYIFQCLNCKSYFIPEGEEEETENPHKRRKTQ